MPAVVGARPGLAGVSLGTDRALRFPVDGEAVAREPGLLSGLPPPVTTGRPQRLDPEARLMGRQDVGVDVARVDELPAGEQVAPRQVLVDRGERGLVGGAGERGGDMDNAMG